MNTAARISAELPVVPQALRAFFETTVKNDRSMKCFLDAPVRTLLAAGVPIEDAALTKSDINRLIRVVGKLRGLVLSGKIRSEFRFEDVFPGLAKAIWQNSKGTSDSCTTKFETDSSCSKKADTQSHTDTRDGKSLIEVELDSVRDISAPLFSPGDLAEVLARVNVAAEHMM